MFWTAIMFVSLLKPGRYARIHTFDSMHTYIYIYRYGSETWWRHQMETFSALLALCEGNPPVTGGFPSQKTVTQSFDIFFDQRLNKRLGKR